MGSKATHQFPVLSTLEPTDLFYVVREVSPGVYVDRSAPRSLLPEATEVSSVLLTNAQLLDLFDTPQQLVPAPSATQFILVHAVTMRPIGGTTNYDSNVYIGGSVINAGAWLINTSLPPVDPDALPLFLYPLNAGGAGVDQGVYAGDNIVIKALGANPLDGDFDVLVKVYYSIVDA